MASMADTATDHCSPLQSLLSWPKLLVLTAGLPVPMGMAFCDALRLLDHVHERHWVSLAVAKERPMEQILWMAA